MSTVTITFVGSGDAFGSGGRLQTCILIDGAGKRIAMDFGATSLAGLHRLRIHPNSIDLIILTHLHGDHCAGVPFLLMDAMLGPKRESPLTIIGPTNTKKHMASLQEALFPGSKTMKPEFNLNYIEMEPEERLSVDGLTLEVVEARHIRDTYPLAVRIDIAGKTVAYTGDGEITDRLRRLVSGVDLLIAESYFHDKPVKWHLNYPDIGRLDAKRVVLTHMHSNMLECAHRVPQECAHDGYQMIL